MSRSDPGEPASESRLERWLQRLRRAIPDLPNAPFFLGLILGFGGCAFAGRLASEHFRFEPFVRFHGAIQPQQFFYPSASQLVAHVRHRVPRGKIPVIVGGASYFRGTGQNPNELWTLELQRLLGERYVVVNFAIDAAPITAYAATVFEILVREYPDILYVADGSPLSGAPWDGGETYQYLFWDAYYKGLLPASLADSKNIRELGRIQRRERAGQELHLGKWLDRFAYACDLWTYIGYNYFFTVWSDAHARQPLRARRFDREGNDPNIHQSQLNVRNDRDYGRSSEETGRNNSRYRFRQGADGQWRPDTKAWDHLAQEWRDMFPAEFRARCFVVFLRGHPYFLQTLTADERSRTELQYRLGQQNLEREGYRVVQLRAEDFTADDFLDGGHYVASGGAKIAHAVAAKIKEATHPDGGGAGK